jgi:hypothetical protein
MQNPEIFDIDSNKSNISTASTASTESEQSEGNEIQNELFDEKESSFFTKSNNNDLNLVEDLIEDLVEEDECVHLEVDVNNNCLKCGTYAIDLFKNKSNMNLFHRKKIVERVLSSNTLKLNIPEEVKSEATKILNSISRESGRLKKRNQLEFYCLYQAYEKLNITKDTQSLASMMGLKSKEINLSALTYFKTQTGKRAEIRIFTAADLKDEFCTKAGLNEIQKTQVEDILTVISARDRSLKDENPKKLICSVIKYVMSINGINYDKASFKQKLGFSDATLVGLCKKISNIYSE